MSVDEQDRKDRRAQNIFFAVLIVGFGLFLWAGTI